MKIRAILINQAGFTLVQAIFVLVVLGLLGGVMVRMISVQSSTSVFALQGARAYQAARSGLEWGALRARTGNSCNGNMMLDGFTVTVTCANAVFVEATTSTTVYQIASVAEFGSYGTPDYVSRRVEFKVAF